MPDDIFNVPEEKLPKLNDQELEHYKKILQIPDSRPCDVDGTLETWLYRISLWGKITLTHINPESKVKHNFTLKNFLGYIDDQSRNAAYGLWSV